MKNSSAIKIPPYHYIHVLDKNSNITALQCGPLTYIRQDHEQITSGDKPIKMIILPPKHYCEITNPVKKEKDGSFIKDEYGQIDLWYGEIEYRFSDEFPEPFPLFPKEELTLKPTPLTVIKDNEALKIEAIRNFKDKEGKEHLAGDIWLFLGPATYYPRIEEKVTEKMAAQILNENEALKLRARDACKDRFGKERKAGEEWLVRKPGAYLPSVFEEIIELEKPYILDEKKAIHLKAIQTFIDVYEIERKAGEEWLITKDIKPFHIVDIYEEFVKIVDIIILTKNQYCIILNPFDIQTRTNRLGAKELKKGEACFFLQPGEYLEGGIKEVNLLKEDEALLLTAKEKFTETFDDKIINHEPGDLWMVNGPITYIPPVQVDIINKRTRIPLDKNEGIYVRDTQSGEVRVVSETAYMLNAHEELWEMELGEIVKKQLKGQLNLDEKGNVCKYKAVTFKVPFGAITQVYDFKKKQPRIIVGPQLVMLQPDEQFTINELSGSKPKKPKWITSLYINLGPDFSTDIVVVETSDHAPLTLQLSYNWFFDVNIEDQVSLAKVFAVKDFVGELCNNMASRIRGAVAGVDFDSFHKNSAKIIRKSIFGVDENGKIRNKLVFEKNNLIVTNVDIQNVEPVNKQTRESLQKTVTLAIESTTKAQEAKARHIAEKSEQEARNELEKLKIDDQSKAEETKRTLLEWQSKSEAITNKGKAIAEAQALIEADKIQLEAQLKQAELKSNASKISTEFELNSSVVRQNLQLEHKKNMSILEISKSKELSLIETKKFQEMVDSIGRETIAEMAKAGPELQAQLLQGLGLQGFLMTDGTNPINLFNTADNLVGGAKQN